MSHEEQVYSPFNQMTLIKQYASEHNLAIVKTYSDEGISGLRIENRPGLRALLAEVVGGRADFSKVLVYDVSRWGRFQDIDESAHYEYLCRRSGVDVVFCAEPFISDNTLISTIGKVLKRGAAAEYSRELSVRIFRGMCNLASRGFALGGVPPYALRKVLVNSDGKRIYGPLAGDRKVQIGCWMSYVPGPVKEVRVVREIFRRYLELRETTGEIANFLNASGARTGKGNEWYPWCIQRILENEKYIGTQVYNRHSSKMGVKPRLNPRSQWIRKPNAFPAIIDLEVFQKVQERRARERQRRTRSDEDLLTALRHLLKKRGRLTERIIIGDKATPTYNTYCKRFGSLFSTFKKIGYRERSKHRPSQERFRRRHLRSELMESIKQTIEAADLTVAVSPTASIFRIAERLTCSLQLMGYREGPRGVRWFRVHPSCLGKRMSSSTFHILARLDADQCTVRDCYLVPGNMFKSLPFTFNSRTKRTAEQYRFRSLSAAVAYLIKKASEPQRLPGLLLH